MVTVINKMSILSELLINDGEKKEKQSSIEKRYENLLELEPESEADVGFIPEPYSEPTCMFQDNGIVVEEEKDGCPYCRCVVS
tara:strand:- start:1145 stop:1393 length:249 start_codon:yes stop_codon:yes gene_type:complete